MPSPHLPWRKATLVLRRWRQGSPLGSAPLLPLHPWWRSQPLGEGGGGEVVEGAVDGAEELGADGVARRPRPRLRLPFSQRFTLGTTPASSSSGCVGRLAV